MKKVIVGKSKGLAEADQCDIHVVGKAFNAFSKISENVIYRSEKYTVNSINMWHEYANITNQKSKEFLSRIPFKDLTNSI
jgi:hypothetical protein